MPNKVITIIDAMVGGVVQCRRAAGGYNLVLLNRQGGCSMATDIIRDIERRQMRQDIQFWTRRNSAGPRQGD